MLTVTSTGDKKSPEKRIVHESSEAIYGGGRRIRTSEVVRRQIYSLFPLATRESLQVKISRTAFHGAGDGTRTRNLLITSQLLCQLSYASANYLYTQLLLPSQAFPRKTESSL
jgi:hypothetical protein